ncbi:FHA domain-containing protein [Nocardioides zeae]
MQQWTLSLSTPPESGLPSVDVVVHAKPEATVADLARAFGRHLAPHQAHLMLVPVDGGHPWPADRALTECGLRTGDLLDVVTAPASWLHRHSSTSRPRAVLRVVDGPDSGQRLQVRSNALTVGRGTTCTMRLTDPLVSTQHVRVVLGTRPTVYDAGSANGTTVAGEQVTTGREVDWGTPIRLGRTTVVVDPGEVPVDDTAVSVFRPPRFGEPLLDETLDVPSPPTRNRPSPLPWAMLALPMIMGLAIFARSQTPYALVYMLAWPMFGYLGWRQQQRAARRQFEEEAAEWRTDVDGMLALIDDQARRQREQFHDDYPDAETLRTRAAQRDPTCGPAASRARPSSTPGWASAPCRHCSAATSRTAATDRCAARSRPSSRHAPPWTTCPSSWTSRRTDCWRSPARPTRSTPWCGRSACASPSTTPPPT